MASGRQRTLCPFERCRSRARVNSPWRTGWRGCLWHCLNLLPLPCLVSAVVTRGNCYARRETLRKWIRCPDRHRRGWLMHFRSDVTPHMSLHPMSLIPTAERQTAFGNVTAVHSPTFMVPLQLQVESHWRGSVKSRLENLISRLVLALCTLTG